MALISDGAFSQGDIMRRLADLERMVANLSTSRRLESASIGQGGVSITEGAVKIYDLDGRVRAQLGKLPDGKSYDIGVFDELGAAVILGALAFGQQSDTVDTFETYTSTTYGDLATVGPTCTLTVPPSGKVLCILSGRIGWSNQNAGGGSMTVDVSGDFNTIPASGTTKPMLSETLSLSGGVTSTAINRSSVSHLYEGLNPGETTWQVKYAAPYGTQCDFTDRVLVLIPW